MGDHIHRCGIGETTLITMSVLFGIGVRVKMELTVSRLSPPQLTLVLTDVRFYHVMFVDVFEITWCVWDIYDVFWCDFADPIDVS